MRSIPVYTDSHHYNFQRTQSPSDNLQTIQQPPPSNNKFSQSSSQQTNIQQHGVSPSPSSTTKYSQSSQDTSQTQSPPQQIPNVGGFPTFSIYGYPPTHTAQYVPMNPYGNPQQQFFGYHLRQPTHYPANPTQPFPTNYTIPQTTGNFLFIFIFF